MGRSTSLRDLIGYVKDKAAVTKAALLTKPDSAAATLAVLRATTHDSATPARDKHVASILAFGNGSRLTAAACIDALMARLHTTGNSAVAIKSLVCIHHIIRDGSFILQDQLCIYPAAGGRNYLNLANFRDDASPATWQLAQWVRWYARALEQILHVARMTGTFAGCSAEVVSGLTNADLLKEIDVQVGVVEEMGRAPDYACFQENRLVGEVVRLAGEESVVTQKELLVRMKDMRDRLGCLSFGESVELVCVLKRLEECKGRVLLLSSPAGEEVKRKLGGGESLLGLVREMKEKVGLGVKETWPEPGKLHRGRQRGTESARFADRVLRSDDSPRFASGRMTGVAMSVMGG